MYNGIGLSTVRGSGTNGYVQRNLSQVRGQRDRVDYKTEDELQKMDALVSRKPNDELLEHERKRRVELKCIEMQELMEEQGYTAEEIDRKVSTFRKMLMAKEGVSERVIDKDESGRPSAKETHQLAEANEAKNAQLRSAFGISDYYVDGSALDPNRQKKEEAARAAALAQKNYNLVQDSDSSASPSPERKRKKKKSSDKPQSDKSDSASPERTAEKKRKKKKRKKKHKHAETEDHESPKKKKKSHKHKKKSETAEKSGQKRRHRSPSSNSSEDSEDSSGEENAKEIASEKTKKKSKPLKASRSGAKKNGRRDAGSSSENDGSSSPSRPISKTAAVQSVSTVRNVCRTSLAHSPPRRQPVKARGSDDSDSSRHASPAPVVRQTNGHAASSAAKSTRHGERDEHQQQSGRTDGRTKRHQPSEKKRDRSASPREVKRDRSQSRGVKRRSESSRSISSDRRSDRSRSAESRQARSRSRDRSRSRSRSGSRRHRRHHSSSSSRSRSPRRSRSHRSHDYSPRSGSRSRSRSPSVRRRRGSPSYLDKRRITSARKRPILYNRPTAVVSSSSSSSSSSSDDDSDRSPHSFSSSPHTLRRWRYRVTRSSSKDSFRR